MKKSEKIMTIGVGGLGAIWLLSLLFSGSGSSSGARRGASSGSNAEELNPEIVLLDKTTRAMEYKDDPFEKSREPAPDVPAPIAKPTRPAGPVLEGIIVNRGGNSAMVSGELVSKGGQVAGMKVLDITQDTVILSDGQKQIELKLQQEKTSGEVIFKKP